MLVLTKLRPVCYEQISVLEIKKDRMLQAPGYNKQIYEHGTVLYAYLGEIENKILLLA